MATPNKLFFYSLGLGTIDDLPLECFLDFRIATRYCVSDDHAIGGRIDVVGVIALMHGYAELAEQCRHRRIDVLIRTCDVVAACLKHACKGGHRGSTDSDQVI